MRPPSITRVLDRLEGLRLVERLQNPRDGRQLSVKITPLGADRMSQYIRAKELWLEKQLAVLSSEDQDQLAKAIVLFDQLAAHSSGHE